MNNETNAATDYADRVLHGTSADATFVTLLRDLGVSLVAAIRPGAMLMVGAEANTLTLSCTPVPTPMGVAFDGRLLTVGGRRDITVFVPSTRLAGHLPGMEGRHDVIFVPITLHRTGECMIHEMAIDGASVVFTNTLFSCIARVTGMQSFQSLWQPSFISKMMPEDRCHLNSFAIEGKRIRYATAFAPTDKRQGFREQPVDSGIIIDVEKNAIVVGGLTRPHSVRVFDGKLYVLNSGVGEVLRVDPETGTLERIAELPGFTRGLHRHGDVLFVGLSTLRVTAIPLQLPVGARADSIFAGIAALDFATGRVLGTLRLPPDVEELFDFAVVRGIRRGLVFDPVLGAPLVAVETPDTSFLLSAGEAPRRTREASASAESKSSA